MKNRRLKGPTKELLKKITANILTFIFVFGLVFSNTQVKASSQTGLTLNKTAVKVDGTCREFTVTLNAKGIPPQKPIDVILVIDRSGSMGLGNKPTSMDYTKAAAINFATSILENSNNRVGIVSYSFNASLDRQLTNNLTQVINSINNIAEEGGTNIKAGFDVAAANMNSNGRNSSDVNRAIILMSDGVANTIINSRGNIESGDNWPTSENKYTKAAYEAGIAAQVQGDVFTVGLFGYVKNNYPKSLSVARDTLKKAQNAGYYETYEGIELNDIYNKISSQINYAASNAVITDIVSDEFEIIPGSITVNQGNEPTIDGNKITWNAGFIRSDNATITYRVKAKDGYYGDYATNKIATIDYKDARDNQNKSQEYPKPVVTLHEVKADAGPDKEIFNGESVAIGGNPVGSGGLAPYTYEWRVKGSDTIISTSEHPSVSPNRDTEYTVIAKDKYGCISNIDTVIVRVKPSADLEIKKDGPTNTVKTGDTITYTLTAKNNGPSNATGVVVSDSLPAGLEYVSDNSNGVYNSQTGQWAIGNLNFNETKTIEIKAKVLNPGNIENTAEIKGNEHDKNLENNRSSFLINVFSYADLYIQKTVNKQKVYNGEEVEYTIKVTNLGPNTATEVYVMDKLPEGLQFISSSDSEGYDSTIGKWTIGTLIKGEAKTLTIKAKAIKSGKIENAAEVFLKETDTDSSNNKATAEIEVKPISDLSVIKIAANNVYKNGEQVTYSISVKNNGPDTTQNAYVTDILPDELEYVSGPESIAVDGKTLTIAFGKLLSGEEKTISFTANILKSGSIINNAVVNGENYDNNKDNNSSEITIEVGKVVDLSIVKEVNNNTPKNGEEIVFTLKIKNQGPDRASNIIVKDALPDGLELIGSSMAYNSEIKGFIIESLNSGEVKEITITAKTVKSGKIVNSSEVTSSEYEKPETLGDNKSSVEVNVIPQADLRISKKLYNNIPTPSKLEEEPVRTGDLVTYTLKVENLGPDEAVNTVVIDKLSDRVEYVSDTSNGNYNRTTGEWKIGTLAKNAQVSINITVRVKSPGLLENTAEVKSDTIDPILENNRDTATVDVLPVSNLEITKSVDKAEVMNGDTVKYTIGVKNLGPDAASEVVVRDVLPEGLQYISSNPEGLYNSKDGTWNIGEIKSGEIKKLEITVKVVKSGEITNIASITSPTYDPDNENNQDSVTIVSKALADLKVEKLVNKTEVFKGEEVEYTIKVTNLGPDTATEVYVMDKIPEGVQFISSSASKAYDSLIGKWTIGTVQKGETVILKIKAKIVKSGEINNTAETFLKETDPDNSNNRASVLIVATIPANASIKVTKQVLDEDGNLVKDDKTTFSFKLTKPDNTVVEFTLKAGESKVFTELQLGTYKIEEMSIPEGYSLQSNKVEEVVLTEEQNYAAVTITNTQNTIIIDDEVPGGSGDLPKTGEDSPYPFYLIGATLILAGIWMRRRQ